MPITALPDSDSVEPTVRTSDRAELLQRLHRHPDDFAATNELRTLDADPGALAGRDDSASDRLVRDGCSNLSRMRAWWSTRRRTKSSSSR